MITLAKQGQYMISYLHPSGQAKNEFRISGPRDCSNSGSGGSGSGTPAGFTPCDCCRANRPQICDRLADFDCRNCGTGSNGGNGERKGITVLFSEFRNKRARLFHTFVRPLQGGAKLMELSLVTHVPSWPIGCAWAGHFAWQK